MEQPNFFVYLEKVTHMKQQNAEYSLSIHTHSKIQNFIQMIEMNTKNRKIN